MLQAKVLIVDDAPSIRDTLKQILERLGVEEENLMTSSSIEEALALFRSERPSVVFMDMNVGADRGDLAAITILQESPSTKVVVVTGMDTGDQRVRDVVSAGAFDVLQKPIRLSRLKQLLEVLESEEKGLRRI